MVSYIDKDRLIGGCSRLPIAVSPKLMLKEFKSISADMWAGTGGRVGVHNQADAIFLRGYAPAEGDKPIEDRDILTSLNFYKLLIESVIPAAPQRCLLAKLKAGGKVGLHVDNGEYFKKYIRIHFPIVTNPDVFMLCAGFIYQMKPGEIWALNNSSAQHAVLNLGNEPRTHLICDFSATDELCALLACSDKTRGKHFNARPDLLERVQ